MRKLIESWDSGHWTGLLFLVGVVVFAASVTGAIYVLLERDARHERQMAERGYCWQYTVKFGGYAPCPK